MRIAVTFLLLLSPFALGEEFIKDIPTQSGLNCRSYLKIPSSDKALIFYLYGTGDHTTYQMHPAAEPFEKEAAILTYDKPGIHVEDNEFHWDEKAYRSHRQSDLLDCALGALHWAIRRTRLDTPVILMGHSEGAQIMVRLYLKLLKDDTDIANRIALIQLSSTPFTTWKKMINDQIQKEEKRTRFWKALENGDEDYFMNISAKVPMGYLQEALKLNALDQDLKEIALLGTATRIELHHGSQDSQTCSYHLKEFIDWNTRQKTQQKPHLDLQPLTYEKAGHDLTEAKEEARNQMIQSIRKAIQ